jgi:hypothetical protein
VTHFDAAKCRKNPTASVNRNVEKENGSRELPMDRVEYHQPAQTNDQNAGNDAHARNRVSNPSVFRSVIRSGVLEEADAQRKTKSSQRESDKQSNPISPPKIVGLDGLAHGVRSGLTTKLSDRRRKRPVGCNSREQIT